MSDDGFIEALHTAGPAGPNAEQLQLFGQFIGSWDIDWSGLDADGRRHTARGELHFGWVLGGRAVQDIWIVPGSRRAGCRRAAAGVPRLDHPLLRRLDRRLALDLDRSRQRPRPPLRRAAGGRRDRAAERRGRASAALALHRHRAGLVHLARRDLPRRRRHMGRRRGDEDHAQVRRGGGRDTRPRSRLLIRTRVRPPRSAASHAVPGRRRR